MWDVFQRLMGNDPRARKFFARLSRERQLLLRFRDPAQDFDSIPSGMETMGNPLLADENDSLHWAALFLWDSARALNGDDSNVTRSQSPHTQTHTRLLPGTTASKLAVCLVNPSLGPTALPTRHAKTALLAPSSHGNQVAPPDPENPPPLLVPTATETDRWVQRLARKWFALRASHFSDRQAMTISLRLELADHTRRIAEQVLSCPNACPRSTAQAILCRFLPQDSPVLHTGPLERKSLSEHAGRRDNRRVSHARIKTKSGKIVTNETLVSDVLLAMTIRSLGKDPRDAGFRFLRADPIWTYEIESLGFSDPQEREDAWQKMRFWRDRQLKTDNASKTGS